jgi:hypothetical protein
MKQFIFASALTFCLGMLAQTPVSAQAANPPAAATAPTQTVGKLTLNAGKYEGEIRDGKATGNGTLTFGDGRKYVGEFKDNKRDGQGTWTIGGFKYEGGWQDDNYHGQGTETYPKGLKYVGEFKDGYRSGQGTMTLPDGRKYEGWWKGNLYVGPSATNAAAATDLLTAVQRLGSDDPGTVRAARMTLLAAGEVGKTHLRKAVQEAKGDAAVEAAEALAEIKDASGLAMAVERLMRESAPVVRGRILRAIGRAAGSLDLASLGQLLIFSTTPAGAEHREAITAITTTRAGGALDPVVLAALCDLVQKDKSFAARGIVEFFAEIYAGRCQRQADAFNALFPKGADRLAALRAYVEGALAEGALDESSRARAVITDSGMEPVVWYTFDDGVRDSSPNGFNGSLDGHVSWEEGLIGSGAVACRSGAVRLPDISEKFTTEATLSVWIKMDSGEARGQGMFNFGTGENDHYPWTDGKVYTDALRKGGVSFPAPAAVDRTKWHHLAVTHKPGPDNWKFYINGAQVCSAAGQEAITLPGDGVLGHGGHSHAEAAFDDFRLYRRALSANEVRDLYTQGNEPAAQNPAAPAAGGGVAVLVDERTVWRHCHLEGPSYFLLDDPAPAVDFGGNPEIVKTPLGPMAKVGMRHGGNQASPYGWPPEATSPAPPSAWTAVAFEDRAWSRSYWPQPKQDPVATGFEEQHLPEKRASPFDTVVVLARSRFEIKDPARVKACRLSLDYWGGVVVYVNGKEAVRGHLPGQEPNLLARLAEPYPEKVLPFKSPGASGGCLRQLCEVEIPAAFLRPGVNVLAVEAHPAPIPYSTWKRYDEYYAWPAIGVARARLTVAPADAAVTSGQRLQGLRVWHCAVSDTVTAGDDLREASAPVEPVVIHAARNSVFSGRLIAGSDQPIKGLTVTVGDLVWHPKSYSSSAKRSSSSTGRIEDEDDDENENERKDTKEQKPGGSAQPALSAGMNSASRIPASAVRVRYAVPAMPGKTWIAPQTHRGGEQGRFDGLLDQIPTVISNASMGTTKFLAPLWFTVRVPNNVRAGRYEGRITIAAQGVPPQTVPLQVRVSDYVLPDPRDWRIQNFIYHAEEVDAKYYGVTNYSARHFELVGKSLALLAELNSRQVQVNLVCDFFANGYGGSFNSNPESLVRWVKQPDGSFKHDFTNFDRYIKMVAETIGKPRTLRLNCWGEPNPQSAGGWISRDFDNTGARSVTVFDPATGQLSRLKQPPLGTEENYRFWKPVFDEVLKKIKARGWLDETTLGYNAWFATSFPTLVDVANRLWPGGEWSFTGHNGSKDMVFKGTATNMIVRHADTIYVGASGRQPLWALDQPRRNVFINNCRNYQREEYPLHRMRTLIENYGVNNGYDGVGDFGANLFPLKRPAGGYYIPAAGAGTGWASDHRSTLALLYPGDNGPVATERFEMLREGAEVCEAFLFVRHALAKKKELLSPDLQQRIERYAKERDLAINRAAFRVRFMPAVEDAKLLDLAGEVARELEGKK